VCASLDDPSNVLGGCILALEKDPVGCAPGGGPELLGCQVGVGFSFERLIHRVSRPPLRGLDLGFGDGSAFVSSQLRALFDASLCRLDELFLGLCRGR